MLLLYISQACPWYKKDKQQTKLVMSSIVQWRLNVSCSMLWWEVKKKNPCLKCSPIIFILSMISVSYFIVGWLVCKPLSRWGIAVLPPYNASNKLTENGLLSLPPIFACFCTLSSLYINNQLTQKSNCHRNNHYLPVVGPNIQKRKNILIWIWMDI